MTQKSRRHGGKLLSSIRIYQQKMKNLIIRKVKPAPKSGLITSVVGTKQIRELC
jgi:hypothetical protein